MDEGMRQLLFVALAVVSLVSFADGWPLLVLRHSGGVNEDPELMRRLVEIQMRYPGCCDEIWFGTGDRPEIDEVRAQAESFARYRGLCDKAGIAVGYQQGLTLGHAEDSGHGKPTDHKFASDVWQRDWKGRKRGYPCPRAPELLEYEYAYAKTVMKVAKPVSYWLDDDLRLSFGRMARCFCDRCIAQFNAEFKHDFSRPELVGRLFRGGKRERVRAEWCRFNAESLAIYGAAVARAADEVLPSCRVSYQAVRSILLYNGPDYRPILEALKGKSRKSAGIRPGDGAYTEVRPRDFIWKALLVMREAERCRGWGDLVGTVCYEQETYPRRVFHKSPDAIVTECTLAMASGCDTLSLYWYSKSSPEPLEDFGRFCAAMAAARPTFARMSANARATRLAGVSRFVGSAAAELKDANLGDKDDYSLALTGVPITAFEAGLAPWYVNEHSLEEMDEGDLERISRGRVLFTRTAWDRFSKRLPGAAAAEGGKWSVVPVPEELPLCSDREAWLDAIDEVTEGRFPVRIDLNHPLRILPRVGPDGEVVQLMVLNCSIGDTGAFTIRLRGKDGERRIEVRNLGAWKPLTLFAEDLAESHRI